VLLGEKLGHTSSRIAKGSVVRSPGVVSPRLAMKRTSSELPFEAGGNEEFGDEHAASSETAAMVPLGATSSLHRRSLEAPFASAETGMAHQSNKGTSRRHSQLPVQQQNSNGVSQCFCTTSRSIVKLVFAIVMVLFLLEKLSTPFSNVPFVPGKRIFSSKEAIALDDELEKLRSQSRRISVRMDELESEWKEQQTALGRGESTLRDELAGVKTEIQAAAREGMLHSLYDTSNAHFTLMRHIERTTSKSRWLFPCDWSRSCTHSEKIEVLANVMKLLEPPSRKENKEKLRIVVLGLCSENLFRALLDGKELQKLVLIENLDKPCQGKGFANQIEREKDDVFEAINMTEEKAFTENSSNFEKKYFDVVIIDTAPEQIPIALDAVRIAWMDKLRNNGLLLGHGYGIIPPAVDELTVHVSWFRDPIQGEFLETITTSVDNFFHETHKRDNLQDDPLRISGDTVWYFFKRKVSISDVFN